MDDGTILARFESCALAAEELTHREHVRIAWLYLKAAPFEEAAPRFCASLRRFADAKGKRGLYHATITWAYLALVNERLQASPAGEDFAGFAERNGDLLVRKGGALAAYYDKETLDSAVARAAFVLPRGRNA